MSKQEKCFARHDLGNKFKKVEKKLGYLIISHDDTLITVAHHLRRLKK